MNTIAIMQPYIFPYIGYFQLFKVCDIFVSYDDVQFMKGGWINRNRILYHGEPKYITFPVSTAPLNTAIDHYFFHENIEKTENSENRLKASSWKQDVLPIGFAQNGI